MGIIANFQAIEERWKSINLQDQVAEIASDNENAIAEYNRKQLYEQGEKADGSKLKKYRNPKYARVKHELNPKPGLGNPDFKVTGEFLKSIFADVRGHSLILDAADYKVEFLINRDGEDIFGLQDENKLLVWSKVLRAPLLYRISAITGAKLST
jgi:hypothetical protein